MIQIIEAAEVKEKFKTYPKHARNKIEQLRDLIYSQAKSKDDINRIEVSLKWGEPSFSVKQGSPIRIDWKERTPDRVSMYFNCSTIIIATIREMYGSLFTFEKNRAIHFLIDEELPEKELRDCIDMALEYQLVKKLPFLGRI